MIIRKTLREQVVEILRHKILSGEIKPGERIIEAKVAEELKVSRGPLREALRRNMLWMCGLQKKSHGNTVKRLF